MTWRKPFRKRGSKKEWLFKGRCTPGLRTARMLGVTVCPNGSRDLD